MVAVRARVKKKIGNLPADPLGQRFCKRFHHPFKAIVAPVPGPDEDTDWTTLNYFLHAANGWAIYCDPNRILGYRFGTTSSYAVIDVDMGGDHHPATNPDDLPAIKAALEKIGICRCVLLQSSNSGGLHILLPLPEEVETFGLACAITLALKDAGFPIRDGHIEVYPNAKPYCESRATNYKAIRCPLQVGSVLLNDDLQPITNDVARFLDVLDTAAAEQDLTQLKRAITRAKKRHKREKYNPKPSTDVDEWRTDWEQIIAQGWTAPGQTNDYLPVLIGYGVVFLGLSGQQLIDYAVKTATTAPGFSQYCGHQRNIAARVQDWCRCTENNRYYSEYASYPERLKKTFAQTFYDAINGTRTKTKNNIVKFDRRLDENYRRSKDAQLRIRQIVSHLEQHGELPPGAASRAKLISDDSKDRFGKTLSKSTLHKYLHLWHPKYHIPDPWVGVRENHSNPSPEPVYKHNESRSLVERNSNPPNPSPEQVYRHSPLMKVLCLPPASDFALGSSDALDSSNSSNSSNLLKSSEPLTHKEIKCQEKSGAVDFGDNSSLSVENPEIDPTPTLATPTPSEAELPAPVTVAEVSAPAAIAPDALTPLTLLDHKQIARLRLQAIAHAQRSVKNQALTSGRLIRGTERTHLERVARMQFYWDSGVSVLMNEAATWAAANPGCLPGVTLPTTAPVVTSQPPDPFSSSPDWTKIPPAFDGEIPTTVGVECCNSSSSCTTMPTPDSSPAADDGLTKSGTSQPPFESPTVDDFVQNPHLQQPTGETPPMDEVVDKTIVEFPKNGSLSLGSTVQVDWFDPEHPCRFHGQIGRITKIDGSEAELELPGVAWRPYLPLNKLKLHHGL